MEAAKITNRVRENISKIGKEDMNHDDLMTFYNQWDEYDESCEISQYAAPKQLAERIPDFLPDKNAKILDIGAGTGQLAKELNLLGYTNIDGMEPAEKFIEFSLEKGYYKEMYAEALFDNQETSVEKEKYDCVVSSGCFANGHVPVSGLKEFARVTKKGGIIGIIFRKIYLETVPAYKNLVPLMKKMEQDGVWKLLKHVITEKYFHEFQGYLVIYEKL